MNGVINVIKPPAMSSSGVVVFLKGLLHEKRIGHAGTLDPGAAGVLPVLVGRSTRLSDLLMSCGKEYVGEVFFGAATDTLDSYGSISEVCECSISEDDFKSALSYFYGEIMQVPPVYSAVKIDGVASYKLARNGKAKNKPERSVFIYAAEFLRKTGENRFLFRVKCSKGTYIRVLAAEIGKRLGVPAHLSFLLRTESGTQRIENSYTIDELKEMSVAGNFSFIIPPEKIDLGLPILNINADDAEKLKNGVSVSVDCEKYGPLFSLYSDNEYLGVGEKNGEKIRIKISLY